MHSAAELIAAHRMELEYVRDLIDWRLAVCDQEPNEWNGDNAFFWRHRLQPDDVPPEVIEKMAALFVEGDLDRVEALARLFIDCYDGYAEGHNYLGLVAQERGDPEEAIERFQGAMTEGRKLFPKRLAKKHYWIDHDTRPYMRAMRNLAVALMRLDRYDQALEVCERMERECGDTDAATTFRAHIYLNMGRWSDAQREAESLVGIWPEHAYVAAFAALEQGDRDDALRWFLYGALNCPRTGRILLGQRTSRPNGYEEVSDHNTGVQELENLESYLARQPRSSRAFFKAILKAPTTREILSEAEEVVQRRGEQHPTGERDAFDRMMHMRSIEFAHEGAERVRPEVMA
jgi:tetratricopeptide (TPR) repeat protein